MAGLGLTILSFIAVLVCIWFMSLAFDNIIEKNKPPIYVILMISVIFFILFIYPIVFFYLMTIIENK